MADDFKLLTVYGGENEFVNVSARDSVPLPEQVVQLLQGWSRRGPPRPGRRGAETTSPGRRAPGASFKGRVLEKLSQEIMRGRMDKARRENEIGWEKRWGEMRFGCADGLGMEKGISLYHVAR